MKGRFHILPLCVAVVFAVKIFAVGEMALSSGTQSPAVAAGNGAPAEGPPRAAYRPAVKDCLDDGLAGEKTLQAALQAQKLALETREEALRGEEQRLLSLKAELLRKMDALRALEEDLNGKISADKAAETKTYKDLGKVYEAMPPAKAGAMLEKLDIPTAAGITMTMKRDKAGAVWGHLNPQRAIQITAAITRSRNAASPEP